MSQANGVYNGADGSPIPNLGRTSVEFLDDSGHKRGLHFQVAEITQPLVSVAGLVDGGNVVVFSEKGGYVHNPRTGRKIQLPRVGNTFCLDMKVSAQLEEEKGDGGAEIPASTFRRPE